MRYGYRGRARRRAPSGLLSLVLALAMAAAAAWLLDPRGRDFAGVAYVTDGDTLRIDGESVRLKGIDAPELAQTCVADQGTFSCGRASREALGGFIGRKPVQCHLEGRDKYRRALAVCRVEDVDIGGWMVSHGYAVSYGDYRFNELEARSKGAGLWSTEFERPEDWRRMHQR
jgi:endonuclease YncB( thermonuclease family)